MISHTLYYVTADGSGGFLGYEAADLPIEDVDWSKRCDHLRTRSMRHPGDIDIAPEWATEAALDEERLVLAPDPSSKSGESIRIVGYSPSANRILVVILVPKDINSLKDGEYWGATAWAADSRTMRLYYGEGGRT